jgi:hypothetical protein
MTDSMTRSVRLALCFVLLTTTCAVPVKPVLRPAPVTTLDSAKVYADSLVAVLDVKQSKAEGQLRTSIGIVIIGCVCLALAWAGSTK